MPCPDQPCLHPVTTLTQVTFIAKRDLCVGEVITVSLQNYTRALTNNSSGEDEDEDELAFAVDCSPFGKIKRALWSSSQRVLNLTVAEAIFQDEPVRIAVPNTTVIRLDSFRCGEDPADTPCRSLHTLPSQSVPMR